MAVTVNEFGNLDPRAGDPIWPASKITRGVASGGNIVLQSTTVYVVMTADAQTYWTMDGAVPTTQDNPLSAGGCVQLRVLPLTAPTIKFT